MAIIFFHTQSETGSTCHIVSFFFHFKNNVLKKWIIVGKWYYVWLLMLTALLKKGASWTPTKEVKIHTLAAALLCSAMDCYDEENRGDFGFVLCAVTFWAHRWGLHCLELVIKKPLIFFLLITVVDSHTHNHEDAALGYERRGNSWCLIVLTTCKFWKPILKSIQWELAGVLQGYVQFLNFIWSRDCSIPPVGMEAF